MATTSACQLVAYGETTGGPVCVCSLEATNHWQGTDQEGSLYGDVVAKMGMATLFHYSPNYTFFNSETGNFVLYRSRDALVLVEIISIEQEASMPWQGIEFTIRPQTLSPIRLQGLTCFFDSSLSVKGLILPQESIYALAQSKGWNMVVLDCDYQAACEVSFESDLMHLEGICFLTEAASGGLNTQ